MTFISIISEKGSLDLFNMCNMLSNRLTVFVFDLSDALVEAESKAHAFTLNSLTFDKTSHSSYYYAKNIVDTRPL
jgi:hypothetical protein